MSLANPRISFRNGSRVLASTYTHAITCNLYRQSSRRLLSPRISMAPSIIQCRWFHSQFNLQKGKDSNDPQKPILPQKKAHDESIDSKAPKSSINSPPSTEKPNLTNLDQSSNSSKDSADSSDSSSSKSDNEKQSNRWSVFFEYLQRFKSLLKRSNRPFNTDDYSAIISWLVMGNALLIFLGTTTFFSLVLLTFNTVFAQEFVATKMGEFITKNSKLSVTFDKAIVSGWRDGRITFVKVLVSRRPRKSSRFQKRSSVQDDVEVEVDDGNYTQYDLAIEDISLTLSFNKWVNGHGIIDTLEMNGVRGTVDRTHVVWDPNDSATNYKNVYQPGDFEIDNFKISDLLVTLHQPGGFRPFPMEIYSLNAGKLRKHWLYFDMLNSDVHGSYDGSLFTIHRRQREFPPGFDTENYYCQTLRINSLNIDHLNNGLEGPFGWITSGKVDMLGDLMVPKQPDFFTRLKHATDTSTNTEIMQDNTVIGPRKNITFSLLIKLNNVKASVPFQTNDLSYINYALIRPIVGYINSHNTYMEVNNQIVKPLKDFEGSWTIYDCLLMDDISVEVYNNFAEYVADEERRLVRMKRIGFWSGQLLLQLFLVVIGALS